MVGRERKAPCASPGREVAHATHKRGVGCPREVALFAHPTCARLHRTGQTGPVNEDDRDAAH